MSDTVSDKEKLNERIEYQKQKYHGFELRPVARLTGKRFQKTSDKVVAVGVMARLQPEELIVDDGTEEYSIPLAQSNRDSLRRITVAGIVVCVLCIALSVITSRILKTVSR